ncbi:MAG TPA: hypothetical protein ENO08_06500, partial [Candidatus Eisenbacteria bacterium]|nr:hypothetical protein [Candidatus Eisenbacteria bacterium]
MNRWFYVIMMVLVAAGARAERVPPARGTGAPRVADAKIGRLQRDAARRLVGAAPASVESLTVGVIRVSFEDLDFGADREGAPHDSLYFENELRHLREYFIGASIGRFSLHTEMQPGVVRLSRPESYYGDDDAWQERISE